MMISKNKHRFIATVLLTLMLVFGGTSVVKAEAQWREDSLLGWVADFGVWEYSPRMGFVYAELSPWVYSLELGWMYGVGGGDVLYWWMPYLDWLLDYEEGYPALLHVESGNLLFVEETSTAGNISFTDEIGRTWSVSNQVARINQDGSTQPAPRLIISPHYALWLKRQGIQGSVKVVFIVNEFGKVEPDSVEIESADHEGLALAVEDVISIWCFEPSRDMEGEPTQAKLRIPFDFKLR